MELKYYLRGLGLGIIVTAIIMGVAASGKQKMTDEEIITRAKQLGMIEDKVLTESGSRSGNDSEDNDSDNSLSNDVSDAGISEAETGGQELETTGAALNELPETDELIQNKLTETDTAQEEPKEEIGQEDDESPLTAEASDGDNKDNEDTGSVVLDTPATVTIGKGDGSYSVSKKLADMGAVASAADFDTFLCANGYDKRIITGNHTIPAGADEEKIARIITGAE